MGFFVVDGRTGIAQEIFVEIGAVEHNVFAAGAVVADEFFVGELVEVVLGEVEVAGCFFGCENLLLVEVEFVK